MDGNINLGGNEEIEKALKEFESKEGTQTVSTSLPAKTDSENSKMVSFVIKHSGGMIKDQRQAEYMLLGIAIVAFGVSLFVFFGGGPKKVDLNNPNMQPLAAPLE